MTSRAFERLYSWGRRTLPIGWRRAIRRRLPVERLFGIRKPDWGLAGRAPARREDIPGRPDVVVLPVIEWGFRRQRPQQLALALGRRGGRVFYADGSAALVRAVADGVLLFPLRHRREDLHERRMREADLESGLRDLGALAERFGVRGAALLVQAPYWRPLAEAARTRFGWKIAYDCLDEHAAFAATDAEFSSGEEARLAGSADVVFATSAALSERLAGAARRVVPLPNACDFEAFALARGGRSGARLRVGYVGAVAEWFDADLLAGVARRRPDWDIEIVGETQGRAAAPLAGLPNVTLAGEVPYEEVPARVAGFDVAVIPFRDTPLTRATDPVKVYEYLAAGKPVVATPLPALGGLVRGRLVTFAAGADEFAEAIERRRREDSEAEAARRRDFARDQTWERRAAVLEAELRALWPLASIVVVTYDNLEYNRACLESVLSATDWPNLEIIAVDNGSSDGTAGWLREQSTAPGSVVQAIFNGENRGFAPAANQGLAAARGDYLCLLNNDTLVTRGWLSALVAHLDRPPALGLVGPSTNEIANEARVPVTYRSLAEMPEWAEKFTSVNRGAAFPIRELAMFCTLMRRDVYARVGALDERFAVGMFEDDDYCRRVRQAGLAIACARDSFVHHRGRGSFSRLTEARYLEIYRENERRYREKWGEAALPQLPASLRARRGVIVFPPSIGWNVTLVQRPHQMARAFARLGHPVVFDCTGSAVDHFEGVVEAEPSLYLYSGDGSALRALPDPILWSFAYNVPDLSAWPGARLVYDVIDDLSVFPQRRAHLEREHRRALTAARTVFAVSGPLLEAVRGERPDAALLPNGVDAEAFASVPPPPAGRKVAGYIGALARWVDFGLVEEVARARPDWEFRFVGEPLDDSYARQGLWSLRNAAYLGPRPHGQMPEVLAEFTAGIIPFREGPETRAISPVKLFEYFAAGRPVVSSPMPSVEPFAPDARIARHPAEWSAALDAAASEAGDPQSAARRRGIARANDWRARAREALERLG